MNKIHIDASKYLNFQIAVNFKMKQLLLLLLCCSHQCLVSSGRNEKGNITQNSFLNKSIFVCMKLGSSEIGHRPFGVARSLHKLHHCINELWDQCLVMSNARSGVRQEGSELPCNKGLTVTTNLPYTYTVNTLPTFHLNITFLRFHLERTHRKCKIHYVQVRHLWHI